MLGLEFFFVVLAVMRLVRADVEALRELAPKTAGTGKDARRAQQADVVCAKTVQPPGGIKHELQSGSDAQ